ncbi:MAG: hypothetical protein IJ630_04430 [Treponema sp.]|nr:hypothetical protein [Treponema sp.]
MKKLTTILFTILEIIMMANAASFNAPGKDFLLIKGGTFSGDSLPVESMTWLEAVEIELEHPYSSNYNTVLNEAQSDQHKQARPALKTKIDSKKWEEYDTIILGYPNWWASIPMPIATLLDM